MSYCVQSNRSFVPVPSRSGSHDNNIKHLAPLTIDTSSRRGSACVNGSVPSIPVPVNRPEMDMLSPLSPDGLTTTSQKAARKPAGMQAVSECIHSCSSTLHDSCCTCIYKCTINLHVCTYSVLYYQELLYAHVYCCYFQYVWARSYSALNLQMYNTTNVECTCTVFVEGLRGLLCVR